jgi:endo-1,4-beta-xylanase
VKIQNLSGDLDSQLERQAEVYGDIARVCVEAENCTALVFWGFTDEYSWIPASTGNPDEPLIFDHEYQPKPAYDAIIAALSGQ